MESKRLQMEMTFSTEMLERSPKRTTTRYDEVEEYEDDDFIDDEDFEQDEQKLEASKRDRVDFSSDESDLEEYVTGGNTKMIGSDEDE